MIKLDEVRDVGKPGQEIFDLEVYEVGLVRYTAHLHGDIFVVVAANLSPFVTNISLQEKKYCSLSTLLFVDRI